MAIRKAVALGVWAWAVGWCAPMWAQTPSPRGDAALQEAVERLTAEAKELDELEESATPPVFQRPHPALVGLSGDAAAAVLDRMADGFTGNEYRDTYIRWHLLEVVKKAGGDALNKESGRVIKLINQMPGPLQVPLLPEFKDEPEEVSRQWHALLGKTRTTVGYPPFERVFWGEAALPYMDAKRRLEMPPILKELERLRPLWKRTPDPKAAKRNDRIAMVNWIVRQYRGELIYVLLMTGDAAVWPRATDAVSRSVRAKDRAAFDILSFMYLAAFDGLLEQYPEQALKSAGEALENIGRSAEGYGLYQDGKTELPGWAPRRERNFADYAFHLSHMLKEGPSRYVGSARRVSDVAVPEPAQYAGYAGEAATPADLKDPARPPVKPEELTDELIRQARDMAVQSLYKIEPQYTFPDEHKLHRVWISGRWGAHPAWQETIHEMGNHALACWAMLAAGQSSQDPQIRRRLNWVLANDAPYAYDRGARSQMLAQMPSDRWSQWVRKDALWLGQAMTESGNFHYQFIGQKNEGHGDHANGQYGVLGLWGVQHAGYSVPTKVWQTVDQYWRSSQDPKTGGWSALASGDAAAAIAGVQKTQTSGPMTAGGVMILSLTDRHLHGQGYQTLGGPKPEPHLERGLRWLDENFALDDASEKDDFFYYMWTIQSVGHASGYRTFNKIDWYRSVTARLLSLQRKDGTWEDNKGTLLPTGFALLYLARAHAPVAISKVRFDGKWNNRPHDLLNFVEWASDEYEVPLVWQVVDADLPVHELIESRMLYLASDEAAKLSESQVEGLGRYIEAGGMLVMVPEGSQPGDFLRSSDELARRLYGESAKFAELPEGHAFYNLHQPVKPTTKVSAVHNGVRPLIVRFNRDIARDLQAYDQRQMDTFNALSNLYLYVTGKDLARPRLDTGYVAVRNAQPKKSVGVARVRHAGTFDPEPYGLQRLAAVMANNHDTALAVETVAPSGLTPDHRIAFLAVTADAALDESGVGDLRKWLEAGGTLWIDAAGGGVEAGQAAEKLLSGLAPGVRRDPLRLDHPIISGKGVPGGTDAARVSYRRLLLQRVGQLTRPRLMSVSINDRPAIIFSGDDLTAALAGLNHWGIYGYTPDSATKLAINGILHANAEPRPSAPTTAKPAVLEADSP